MLDIMTTENKLASIKDIAIKKHIESALTATREIDKSALKVAYHVAATKPLLEGNTSGLPTKFEDFCSKIIGVKKAQAYNLLAIGTHVSTVTSTDGKKTVYVDDFTMTNLMKKYDLATQYDEYYAAIKKAKSLGSTQILTILQLQNSIDFHDDDVCEMLESGKINAGMTIKALKDAIKGAFNAIESKSKEETTTEETTTEETTAEETTAEKSNQMDFVEFKLGKNWVSENLKPELTRYAEDAPAIAELLKKIDELLK